LPRRIFDFRVPHVVVERVVGDLDVTKRAEHAQLKIKCYRTYELLLNTILKIDWQELTSFQDNSISEILWDFKRPDFELLKGIQFHGPIIILEIRLSLNIILLKISIPV
jgi:hypothetical protein